MQNDGKTASCGLLSKLQLCTPFFFRGGCMMVKVQALPREFAALTLMHAHAAWCCPQAALESAAEDAMAEAVKRMNRAVEMVADAESRAAAAAAMATAYQDISDGQAEAARAAADLPAMPARQAQAAGHIANLQKVLHEQMFSASSLISDWVAGVWAAIVGAVAWVQASVVGAWAGLVGAVSGAAKGT
jgi:hypothetical protein